MRNVSDLHYVCIASAFYYILHAVHPAPEPYHMRLLPSTIHYALSTQEFSHERFRMLQISESRMCYTRTELIPVRRHALPFD